MTTPELITYIKSQIKQNTPKNIIISNLAKVGWYEEDIREGFLGATESSLIVPFSVNVNTNPVILSQNNKLSETQDSTKIEPPSKPQFKPKPIINSNLFKAPTIPDINTQTDLKKTDNNELIPNLIPKENVPVPPTYSKENSNSNKIKDNTPETFFTDESNPSDLSKMAMIESFPKEFSKASALINKNKVLKTKKFYFPRWIFIIFIVIVIAGGIFFALKGNYIKIPEIQFPFTGIDSKETLLNSPNILSSMLSYKVETRIKIVLSSPAGPSKEISTLIDSIGIVDQKGLATSSQDNTLTIQNTNLEGNFVTNLKNTGEILFLPISDLNQFLIKKSKEDGMLAVKEGDFNLIRPLLPEDFQERLKDLNIHKFLSEGLSSYLDNKIIQAYKEYISNVEIKDEKLEEIQGIETYHYNLDIDLIAAQKLLSQIDNNFTLNSNKKNEGNSGGKFDSLTVDSFEVWVSKKNNTLFKYKIVFNLPFSSVDKLFSNKNNEGQVKIDLQATYYDLGVLNKIKMPDKIIMMDKFINNIEK